MPEPAAAGAMDRQHATAMTVAATVAVVNTIQPKKQEYLEAREHE
jgi:hypothetical protein